MPQQQQTSLPRKTSQTRKRPVSPNAIHGHSPNKAKRVLSKTHSSQNGSPSKIPQPAQKQRCSDENERLQPNLSPLKTIEPKSNTVSEEESLEAKIQERVEKHQSPGVTSLFGYSNQPLATIVEQDSYSTFHGNKSEPTLDNFHRLLSRPSIQNLIDFVDNCGQSQHPRKAKNRHVSVPERLLWNDPSHNAKPSGLSRRHSCDAILQQQGELTSFESPILALHPSGLKESKDTSQEHQKSKFHEDFSSGNDSSEARALTPEHAGNSPTTSNISRIIRKLLGSTAPTNSRLAHSSGETKRSEIAKQESVLPEEVKSTKSTPKDENKQDPVQTSQFSLDEALHSSTSLTCGVNSSKVEPLKFMTGNTTPQVEKSGCSRLENDPTSSPTSSISTRRLAWRLFARISAGKSGSPCRRSMSSVSSSMHSPMKTELEDSTIQYQEYGRYLGSAQRECPHLIPSPLVLRHSCGSRTESPSRTATWPNRTPQRTVVNSIDPCTAQKVRRVGSPHQRQSHPSGTPASTRGPEEPLMIGSPSAAIRSTSSLSLVAGLTPSDLGNGSGEDPFFTCRESPGNSTRMFRPSPLRPRRRSSNPRYVLFPMPPTNCHKSSSERRIRSLSSMLRMPGGGFTQINQPSCPHGKEFIDTNTFDCQKVHKTALGGMKRFHGVGKSRCWRCNLEYHWRTKVHRLVPEFLDCTGCFGAKGHDQSLPQLPGAPPPTVCSSMTDEQPSTEQHAYAPRSPALEYTRQLSDAIGNRKHRYKNSSSSSSHSWKRFSEWATKKWFCAVVDGGESTDERRCTVPTVVPAKSRVDID